MTMTAEIPAAASSGSNFASGPTILIVDDSALDRRLTGCLLERGLDARIVAALNGVEAMEILRREEPALILTDLRMPKMDGLELVEQVRSNYPSLPIILTTAHGSEELALQALQAGAAGYVPKRELGEQLVFTVEKVLANARRERRHGRVLECARRFECDYVLDNDPAFIPIFIAHLQEQMISMKLCNENGKIRLGVALEEALLNGLYHGNLELSSDLRQDGGNTFNRMADERRRLAPYSERRLHVQVRISSQEAFLVIRDEGPGFDISKLPDPTDPENLLKASGRGLLLIRTFMDEVIHNLAGNQITMIKRN